MFLYRRAIFLMGLKFSPQNFTLLRCPCIRGAPALNRPITPVVNKWSWTLRTSCANDCWSFIICGIAAAWNADTRHGTHGSRGLLRLRGTQSGHPRRSGHYLTVRR